MRKQGCPKRQINIRVSPATAKKIDKLREAYGTTTEVIAVAVEMLYSRSYPQENEDSK